MNEILPQAVAKTQRTDSMVCLLPLVPKIPWGHNILLMEKVKDLSARLWYVEQALEIWRARFLIAKIFHRLHFVERWGRGISLILSKESTAEFEEIGELFCVTFKRKRYKSKMQHEMKLPQKLPELQKSILDNTSKNSRITYVQLADIMIGQFKRIKCNSGTSTAQPGHNWPRHFILLLFVRFVV